MAAFSALLGNGPDHIQNTADIGAALGHQRHCLVSLMHVFNQGMDLVAGIAQGLLGGIDVMGCCF